jgi:hypothetical protein
VTSGAPQSFLVDGATVLIILGVVLWAVLAACLDRSPSRRRARARLEAERAARHAEWMERNRRR